LSDPEQVRDRWLALQEPGAVAEMRERCEAAAVEQRPVAFSWWTYLPRPFSSAMAGEDLRHGRGLQDARLGVDAAGRPVFQHLRDDLFQLYDWADTHCDLVECNSALRKLHRFVFAGEQLVEEIIVDGQQRLDGRPAVEVTRWFYEDGRPALAIETYESGSHMSWGGPERGPYWRAKAYPFTYDAGGDLASIRYCLGARDFADGGDVDEAQAQARASFPRDFVDSPLYDARTQRAETDLPDPEHAYEGLAEPLGDALFAALEQRRGELGPLEFVCFYFGGAESRAIAADETYVARALRMTTGLRELLLAAYEAPQGTVRVDATDAAPADVLRGLRAGQQALAHDYGSRRPEEFRREVLAALNARPWTNVAPTFIVVNLPPDDKRRLPDLTPIVGRERVEAFLERMTRRAAPRLPRGPLRPRTRAELAALLQDAGLTAGEAARVAAGALWGIVLEPGGTGVSRLGGAPVLPAGTPWPLAGDRPLTHLATIALDELPAVDGREHLPDSGLLSFFADISEEGEFVEPIEPGGETSQELVAVVHTPAGAPAYEPEPPDEALDEQRVTPRGRLQLPHRRFGIDPLAQRAVERLTERVNGSIGHQLLGHPWPVQEDPREPGQIALFHIADDGDLGFGFLDAGAIHFLGRPADIRAGRWDQLTVVPESC
jgi:hypothetical protein